MEIKQLKRFLCVIENESFSSAARMLGITQQALSTSISNLENEIGLPLFERSPGGITRPTAYGRALVRHARSQVSGTERAVQELHAIRDATSGTITVGIGETFSSEIMAAAISKFHSLRPEIRINIVEGYSELLLERLRHGEFDFMVGATGGLYLSDDIVQELLYSTDDIVVARGEHPLAGRKSLQLQDLQEYTWMVPYSRSSDFDVIVNTFVSENITPPKRIMGTDTYMLGLHLLLTNDFLIMTTPALVGYELRGERAPLALLDIDRPTVRRHARLIYPRNRPMTPAAAVLLQEVRDACEDQNV